MRNILFLMIFSFISTACNTGVISKKQPIVLHIDDISVLQKVLEGEPGGSVIRLAPGTYHTLSPIRFQNLDNLRLEAQSAYLILESTDDNVIEVINSSRLAIVGIHARHAKPSGPVGCLGSVILIENSEQVEIAESELDGSGIVGIAAYDSPDLLIRDNYIHNNSSYPVVYQGPSVTFMDNRFEDNGNRNCIGFSTSSENWPPEQNICKDTTLIGLHMEGNRFE